MPQRPWWWDEASELRAKARSAPLCSPDDHRWKRYNAWGQLLAIICERCGRIPTDALAEPSTSRKAKPTEAE